MSVIDNFGNTKVLAQLYSNAYNRNVGLPKPPTSFAGENAMVEIHEDTPYFVTARFGPARRLLFQFIDNEIPDNANPRYNTIDIPGRSESYMSYAGGDNRKVSLTLSFVSSVQQNDNGEHGTATQCINWLKAATMPSYFDGGVSYGPPVLRLILGRFIRMRCVLTGLNITHKPPWVGGLNGFEFPLHVQAEAEFTEVNNRPKDVRDFLTSVNSPSR